MPKPPKFILRQDGRPKYISARTTSSGYMEVRVTYRDRTSRRQISITAHQKKDVWDAYVELTFELARVGIITIRQLATMRLSAVYDSWLRHYARYYNRLPD